MERPKSINVYEAARWLATLASVDGVISANERRLLRKFADEYGLDGDRLIRMAYARTNDVDVPEVEKTASSERMAGGHAF